MFRSNRGAGVDRARHSLDDSFYGDVELPGLDDLVFDVADLGLQALVDTPLGGRGEEGGHHSQRLLLPGVVGDHAEVALGTPSRPTVRSLERGAAAVATPVLPAGTGPPADRRSTHRRAWSFVGSRSRVRTCAGGRGLEARRVWLRCMPCLPETAGCVRVRVL